MEDIGVLIFLFGFFCGMLTLSVALKNGYVEENKSSNEFADDHSDNVLPEEPPLKMLRLD